MTEIPQAQMIGPAGSVDPSLFAGAQAPSTLNPEIEQFLTDSVSLSPEARQRHPDYRAARNEAMNGAGVEKVVIPLGGDNYWGREHHDLVSFDGELRGNFEHWEEPTEANEKSTKIATQALAGPGSRSTHIFFETDDGHMVAIRQKRGTADIKSAADQQFELISTTSHMGKEDVKQPIVRDIPSEQLKGIFARPGEPLVLGVDPATGKPLRTRGNITRIISMQQNEEGRADPRHPVFRNPDFFRIEPTGQDVFRDTPTKFMEAVRQARNMDVASKTGPLTLSREASLSLVQSQPESLTPEPSKSPEQLIATQLEAVRAKAMDAVVRSVKMFDVNEFARASMGLFAAQRDLEKQLPDRYPSAHTRERTPQGVIYGTTLDTAAFGQLVDNLKGIDGVWRLIPSIRNLGNWENLESVKQSGVSQEESVLRQAEADRLLYDIFHGLKDRGVPEDPQNPYSIWTDDKLGAVITRFPQTIADLTAQGRTAEADNSRKQLAAAQAVVAYRQQARSEA